jgi:hypothetical protein
MNSRVCDHANRKRCVQNCRHANPRHRMERYATCTCEDTGECHLNPYLAITYKSVRCVRMEEGCRG